MIAPETLARPYATAAFAVASDSGKVDEWASFLCSMADLMKVALMRAAVTDPSYRHHDLALVVSDILHGEDEHIKNFIRLLAERRRFGIAREISELFSRSVDAMQGKSRYYLQAAAPVSDSKLVNFIFLLEKKIKRKVVLELREDKSLMGGVCVRAGDKVLDYSIKSHLAQFETAVSQVK